MTTQKRQRRYQHNSLAFVCFVFFVIGTTTEQTRFVSSLIPTTTTTIPVSAKRSTTASLLKASSSSSAATETMIPSWEDLEAATRCSDESSLLPIAKDGRSFSSDPDLSDGTRPTLYRERHGWCPYSERVWLALEAKGIEHDTIYIDNIYGRPSWYGGNTPQMKWEDGSTQSESMDLVREIDERYPGGEMTLYPGDIKNEVVDKGERAFRNIFPKRSRPSSRAAFLFRYDGSPLWKNEFEKTLRETDALLGETASDGPFFCGSRFTAADIAWAPFLERYAGQLPCLHEGLDPRCPETYPHLHEWYRAMETEVPAYACRVRGDPSSWRKVLTMAGFGNAGNVPDLVASRMEELAAAERAPLSETEAASEQELWETYAKTRPHVTASSPREEVATVLVRNRENIARDTTKNCPDAALAENSETLDEAMRALAVYLCDDGRFSDDVVGACETHRGTELRSLAAFLDDRMCVPRDMGALSAAWLKRI